MEKFTQLRAKAAILPLMNVDTDMIIPKQFLKTIKRTGLGKSLFFEMRYDQSGAELPDFPLNSGFGREAKILISGGNFGCGSSREHAPWALLDFGIRCVIAPSFADIFYNNCFKNSILPLVLPIEKHDKLVAALRESPGLDVDVDLPEQKVMTSGFMAEFEIEPFRKTCLVEGLDEIGLTLLKEPLIAAFERRLQQERPWL